MFCDGFLKHWIVRRLAHEGIEGSDFAGRGGYASIREGGRCDCRAVAQRNVEVLVGIGAIVLVLGHVEDNTGGEFKSGNNMFRLGVRDLFLAYAHKLVFKVVDGSAGIVRLGRVEKEVVHCRVGNEAVTSVAPRSLPGKFWTLYRRVAFGGGKMSPE